MGPPAPSAAIILGCDSGGKRSRDDLESPSRGSSGLYASYSRERLGIGLVFNGATNRVS